MNGSSWTTQVVFSVSIVAILLTWGLAGAGVPPSGPTTSSPSVASGQHLAAPTTGPAANAPSSSFSASPTASGKYTDPTGARGAAPTPDTPGPLACPNPPIYLPMGSNNLLPPYPSVANSSLGWVDGSPQCFPFFDSVHDTFSSDAPGSGSQFEVPVDLPQNPSGAESNLLTDINVGMVVQGDAKSAGGQSWAEVYFVPETASNDWDGYLAVWSATQSTLWYTAPSGNNPASCGGASQGVVWSSGATYCVVDALNGGNGESLGTFAGGDSMLVAFSGTPASGTGMMVYVNDTTSSTDTSNQLSGTDTSSDFTFTPAFSSACLDFCELNWSGAFGLGVGIDLCDSTIVGDTCFSYNDQTWNSSSPLQIGVPLFVSGGIYSGQYKVLAPESLSGHCSGVSTTVPSVVQCSGPAQESGFYPAWSFNGTGLNFGSTWPWAVVTWGGGFVEFGTYGGLTDNIPLFPDNPTNSSQDGFIPSGSDLTVTTHVTAYGTVTQVNLNYTLNGAGGSNLTMTLQSGNDQDGVYTATIPSGADGTLAFRVWATDLAGGIEPAPTPPAHASLVYRGALPTFQVSVLTTQPNCGGVLFNGTEYANGAVISTPPGYYSLEGVACYPFVFANWWTTPGVQPPASYAGTVGISASGTLQENQSYVRPYDSVTLDSNPTSCSSVFVNGTEYTTPTGILLQGPRAFGGVAEYSLGVADCGGYEFSGWTIVNADPSLGVISILGNDFNITGNGTITENFVSLSSNPKAIDFDTVPTSCPGILFQGAGYVNGQSVDILPSTPYAIQQDPCDHYGFTNFTTTAGLTISGGELTATEGGIVTENNYHLTQVELLTHPANCGFVDWDGVDYADGSPNSDLNLTNHTVHTAIGSPCAGYYFIGFLATGGVSVLGNTVWVNASGSLQADFLPGSPNVFVGFLTSPPSCGSIYLEGQQYNNSQYTHVGPGTVLSITASACTNYGFVSWITNSGATNGISIKGGTAYINDSGSIEALFEPLVALDLSTSPISCGDVSRGGGILLNGQAYGTGAVVQVPEGKSYALTAGTCEGMTFSSWENSSGSEIADGQLTVTGPAILTAVFVPAHFDVTIVLGGVSCGSVEINHQGYGNNSTVLLLNGSYSISASPCAGELLLGWNATGGLNVSNGTIRVLGPGTVTAEYGYVPLSISLSGANSSYTQTLILFEVTVASPIPPYTYNYTWNFGDGTTYTTPANFTSHAYTSSGTFTVTVTVVDPQHRTATQTMTVTVTTPPPLNGLTLSDTEIGVLLGVIALFVVAIVVVLLRQGGRGGGASEGEGDANSTANAQELVGSSPPPPTEDGSTPPEEPQ